MQQQQQHEEPSSPFMTMPSSAASSAASNSNSTMDSRLDSWKDSVSGSRSTTGNARRRLDSWKQSISTTLQSGEVTQRRQQVQQGLDSMSATWTSIDPRDPNGQQKLKKGFQKFGSKLQQNFSTLQNNATNTISNKSKREEPGLTDQLGMLNERMKEEQLRQTVRREAEQASLKIMEEHLVEFSRQHQSPTYEEWIEALHPENAHQGRLLAEMQEIDMRFYVQESDHLQLWNRYHDINNPLRHVQARTQMWSDKSDQNQAPVVDLLSMETVPTATTPACTNDPCTTSATKNEEPVDLISFF